MKWGFLKEKNSLFNIANLFSISRLFLVAPLLLSLFAGELNQLIIILLLILITDVLDGFLARRFNLVSEFGENLDTVIDGVWFFSLLFSLFLTKDIINNTIIIFLISFVLLVTVRFASKIRRYLWLNKLNGFACTLMIISLLFNLNWLLYPSIIFSVLLMNTLSISSLYIQLFSFA